MTRRQVFQRRLEDGEEDAENGDAYEGVSGSDAASSDDEAFKPVRGVLLL